MNLRPGRSVAASIVLAALCGTAGASHPSPDLVVEAPPSLASVAEEVERIGAGDFQGPLIITGLMGFRAPIRVVLAPEDSPVARSTPGWISGFANGADRTIVLFPARVSSYPDTNMTTLVHHEVAHILVFEAARGRPVPRWFNEGLATVAAREWGIEDRARYAAAVVGRGPRNTEELDQGFVEGGRRATRSYALSGAFVRWLQLEYGGQVAARILELLGRDGSFREAFVRSTGDTLERAEERFFVREAFWHMWVPFLTSSGVLWAGIVALALVAIRRRRMKSAAMRDRWDAEEELVNEGSLPEKPRSVGFRTTSTLDDTDDEVVN